MTATLFPLISYVLISTFTPGPSNISTASLAVIYRYQKTLAYQFGLAMGVFLFMFMSGLISGTLMNHFPFFEPALRYIGAAYILYLAYSLLKASYHFEETEAKPLGFLPGFLLQILNPKLLVYAFTLFAGFLAPITGNLVHVTWTALLLAVISFCSTSVWALAGTAIQSQLRQPQTARWVNVVLALLLVYTAVSLAGFIP